MEAGETVTIHTHASFCKVLFDKGANCKRDCPFKVAFGEGQSLWPHNCTGSTPISGVIGVGVKSNEIFPIFLPFYSVPYFMQNTFDF